MYMHQFTQFFLSLTLVAVTPTYVPTYLLLMRVGPCHRGQAITVVVNEMSVIHKARHFSISGRLNVTRDIPDGWMVRATMEKCQDIRNLDTCDHFKARDAIEGACTADASGDDMYQALFNVTTPRLGCPIRAGVYQISDYPFVTRDSHFMVSESKISTSMFGYTYRLDAYSDDKKIMCVEAYLKLAYSKNKNNENHSGDDDDDDDANDDDKIKDGGRDVSKANDGKVTAKGVENKKQDDFEADNSKAGTGDTKTDHLNTDANGNDDDSKAEDPKDNGDDSKVDDGTEAKQNVEEDEGDEN